MVALVLAGSLHGGLYQFEKFNGLGAGSTFIAKTLGLGAPTDRSSSNHIGHIAHGEVALLHHKFSVVANRRILAVVGFIQPECYTIDYLWTAAKRESRINICRSTISQRSLPSLESRSAGAARYLKFTVLAWSAFHAAA